MNLNKPLYHVQPLSEHHDRKSFSCGIDALDKYFWQQAGQEVKKHITATFVLSEIHQTLVMGYYTLSSIAVNVGDLPKEITKKFPKYPLLPATLLGRLAVHKEYYGRKLGELLLMDAFQRSLRASKEIASMAVIVDAKDDQAIRFYKKYGFIHFPKHARKLFLPMSTISKLLNH